MKPYDILFISPVIPLRHGPGISIRGWMFLQALAERYRLLLMIFPVGPRINQDQGFRALKSSGVDFIQLQNRSYTDAQAGVARIGNLTDENRFKAVHVFRLYMLPLIRKIFELPRENCPRIILDLDDYESKTQARLAEHAQRENMPARYWVNMAKQTERLENRYLKRCDRVYVCTNADRDALNDRFKMHCCRAIPNAVEAPQGFCRNRNDNTFNFLFVGTMGYFPNEDAVLFFYRRILPIIRRETAHPVRLIIVGANPGPTVWELSNHPGVSVTGFVPDTADYYGQADAAIVPIRVGGGMRIKILEAFRYHCPVISTTAGSEGIDAVPDKHLLIADTAEDFAGKCLRLIQEPALGEILSENARKLVETRYSLPYVQEMIRRDYQELLGFTE